MELRIFNSLRKLNRRFYDVYAESFSKSRHTVWPGWLRLADVLEEKGFDTIDHLDVAAGNGRFEAFMGERFPYVMWNSVCIDLCDELMSKAQGKLAAVGFGNMTCFPVSFDVLDFLISYTQDGTILEESICDQNSSLVFPDNFDLVTCFGFMHHVYSVEMRQSLMNLLLDQTKPGGLVAVSFWCFMRDEDFAQKAEEQTMAALKTDWAQSLMGSSAINYREPGDYLLGWQGNTDLPRYCHSFSDDEITQLIESVADRASLVDRYSSDGRSKNMNEYIILRSI